MILSQKFKLRAPHPYLQLLYRLKISSLSISAGEKQKPLENNAGERTIAWLDKIRNSNGSIPTSNIRLNMQRVMQNNAAVFRTQETLEEGIVFHQFII